MGHVSASALARSRPRAPGSPSTLPAQTSGVMGCGGGAAGTPGALLADRGKGQIFLVGPRPASSDPLDPSSVSLAPGGPPLSQVLGSGGTQGRLCSWARWPHPFTSRGQAGVQLPSGTHTPRWLRSVPWSPPHPPTHPDSRCLSRPGRPPVPLAALPILLPSRGS